MNQFFATDYQGAPFVLFDAAHLTALGIIILVNLALFPLRRVLTPWLRQAIRYALAALLVVNRIALHIWNIANDQWSIQWQLPLHLCSVFLWLSVYMLVTRSYPVFELAYFLGIGGATQALLTPDAGIYGFPHFYPVQFFITHGGIVTASVYMAVVEGYRPYWASLKKVFLWGNLYLAFVTVVNLLIGSNYMYTLRKPHVPTLLDHLGPWPWYLLSAEVIALLIFLALYAPYAIRDRNSRCPTPGLESHKTGYNGGTANHSDS